MIGHPLVLDQEYGNPAFNRVFTQEFGLRSFFLHAEAISLPHPVTGKTLEIRAPLPLMFSKIVKTLGSLGSV